MIETTEFSVVWRDPSDDVSVTYSKLHENVCICRRTERSERITTICLKNGALELNTFVLNKSYRFSLTMLTMGEYLTDYEKETYCRSNLGILKNAFQELKHYMTLEFVQLIESLIEN